MVFSTPYFLDTCILLDSIDSLYPAHYKKCKNITNRNDFHIVSNTHRELQEIRKRRASIYLAGLKQFQRYDKFGFKEIEKTDFINFFESLSLSNNDKRHIENLWERIKGSSSLAEVELNLRREMAKIQNGIDTILTKINTNTQIKIEIRITEENIKEKEKVIKMMIKEKKILDKFEVSSDLNTIFEIAQWLSEQGVIGILVSSDHPHIIGNKYFLEKEIFSRLEATLQILTITQFSNQLESN